MLKYQVIEGEGTYLVAVVPVAEYGAGGDVGNAQGLPVQAHCPVDVLGVLSMQHGQVLLVQGPVVNVPGYWITAQVRLHL